jgi:hypothetical protein
VPISNYNRTEVTMPSTDLLAKAIRTHQYHLPETGTWWRTIHKFLERTLDEFWYSTTPYPVLSMEETDGLSHYDSMNGMGLRHVIVLNHQRIRDGEHAAELLAHELVHLHQDIIGVPTVFNIHTEEFHSLMFTTYGIATHGANGVHTGYTGRWEEWLEENLDLGLGKFKFGGS